MTQQLFKTLIPPHKQSTKFNTPVSSNGFQTLPTLAVFKKQKGTYPHEKAQTPDSPPVLHHCVNGPSMDNAWEFGLIYQLQGPGGHSVHVWPEPDHRSDHCETAPTTTCLHTCSVGRWAWIGPFNYYSLETRWFGDQSSLTTVPSQQMVWRKTPKSKQHQVKCFVRQSPSDALAPCPSSTLLGPVFPLGTPYHSEVRNVHVAVGID